MRYNKDLFDLIDSGNFTGSNRPSGRVTIEADWQLNTTNNGPNWGNSIRGPFRWWQNSANSQTEHELPNIKSINIDRSISQDIATCTIEIYNQWHDDNGATPEDLDQLGKPGFFWPGHGTTTAAQARWNQSPSQGAYLKNGSWDSGFDWEAALVPYGLLRTYQGYGGESLSLSQAITQNKVFITGVWLIETVSANTSGMLTLACKDIGKLLIDQLVMPPLIPSALHPLEYVPDGKSAFDSYWEPKAKTGVSPASQGRVPMVYHSSSAGVRYNATATSDPTVYTHKPSHAVDKRDDTYAISYGFAAPNTTNEWFQFQTQGGVGKTIDQIDIRPWAGGYTCYLSLHNGTSWLGSTTIPSLSGDVTGTNINYVTKVTIPYAIPDGKELKTSISVPSAYTGTNILYYRLTFTNHYYGNFSGQTTDKYRCGIRETVAYIKNAKASGWTNPTSDDPWTYSMAAHPTRGYWIMDDSRNIYEFGDAVDYTSSINGSAAPLTANGQSNNSVAMAAHPSGNGYWVLYRNGYVEAYGAALRYTTYGGYYDCSHLTSLGADLWGAQGLQAFDIAPTYTGNGYYVVLGNGRVYAFGDATSTAGMTNYVGDGTRFDRPTTQVDSFMQNIPITILVPADNPLGFTRQDVYTYATCRRGTSVTAHPTQLGFWVTSASGEVSAVGTTHHGQLVNRVYNAGGANSFRLTPHEMTHAIRSTTTGKGYWIAFGSGHIAAFGDAMGQGPTDIYGENPSLELNIPDNEIQDWSFFRAIVWSLAPDPDGSGFWLLAADGSVGHYNAEFWGQPGYYGMSGYRWFEGNYESYEDIIKELLLWAGFLLYNASQPSNEEPPVYGGIESMGIPSDAHLKPDKFDKRTIIDIITELKQIVGYSFWIDETGSATLTSPNWWQAGNLDENGVRIYVDGDGEQVNYGDPGATLFIPEINETLNLIDYTAQLTGESLRSEIIIGNNQPDYRNPASTGYVRHYPSSATADIRPGVPALRNILKPAMWVSEGWANTEEMQLMAELINLQIWFSQRTGSATIAGNPLLSINDQVTILERNTSEVFLHYVRGVNSTMDLDTGVYTMTLTTNWLGSDDDWVITTAAPTSPDKIQITNRVDRWQSNLGLGLSSGLGSTNQDLIISIGGGFVSTTTPYDPDAEMQYQQDWIFRGTIDASNGIDDLSITVLQWSANLGAATLTIGSDLATPVDTMSLSYAGQVAYPGTITDLDPGSYEFTVTGTPQDVGNAVISLRFDGSNVLSDTITDSTIFVAVPSSQSFEMNTIDSVEDLDIAMVVATDIATPTGIVSTNVVPEPYMIYNQIASPIGISSTNVIPDITDPMLYGQFQIVREVTTTISSWSASNYSMWTYAGTGLTNGGYTSGYTLTEVRAIIAELISPSGSPSSSTACSLGMGVQPAVASVEPKYYYTDGTEIEGDPNTIIHGNSSAYGSFAYQVYHMGYTNITASTITPTSGGGCILYADTPNTSKTKRNRLKLILTTPLTTFGSDTFEPAYWYASSSGSYPTLNSGTYTNLTRSIKFEVLITVNR